MEKATQAACGGKGGVSSECAQRWQLLEPGGPGSWAAASAPCCSPQVAPVLKERMVKKGTMMIGYQPHGTRANFFRMVVANPVLVQADIDFLLGELERLGQDL